MQSSPNVLLEPQDRQTGAASKRERRYSELDSLRGLAALSVVFYHFKLMWTVGNPRWLVLVGPFATGHEAVILFFLLSGFVLSIQNLQGKKQPYPVFLVRRILRIYAPYLFAMALAVGGAGIWHGPLLGHSSWADKTWFNPVSGQLVLAHIAMIGNYDWAQYNTAFWSLVVEMRMSIIFPFLFVFVRRLRVGIGIVLTASLVIAGAVIKARWPWTEQTIESVMYAGVFVCGIVMATNIGRLSSWFRGLNRGLRLGICVVSFVLYTYGHHLSIFIPLNVGADLILIMTGAVGYMMMAINSPMVKATLHMAWARFLGRISYSLYLVHGTVLFALTHVFGNRLSALEHFALYLPTSLMAGYVFCILVEERFLRLSRRFAKSALTSSSVVGKQ